MSRSFKCNFEGCKKIYSRSFSLKRHQNETHDAFSLLKCIYPDCQTLFKRKDALHRHINSVHSTEKFDCLKCNVKLSRKDDIIRHMNVMHGESTHFECSECGYKSKRKDYLRDHIRMHNPCNDQLFICDTCGIKCRYKYGLIKHIMKIHSNETSKKPQISKTCALCYTSVERSKLTDHYVMEHDVILKKHNMNFPTKEDFYRWKINMEDSTNSSFRKVYSHKLKKYTRIVFHCHRSGSVNVKMSERKRRLKVNGSKKLNAICPSEIILCINNDLTCDIKFVETHLGHSLTDEEELRHIFPKKDTHLQLASKATSDTTLNRVSVVNQTDNLLENLDLNLKRIDLLTNDDLRSIENTFSVSPDEENSRLSDDSSNFDAFITRYPKWILYYKQQNVSAGEKYPSLKDEDVVLIFMCETQKKILEKHGHNVICMNTTHGMNEYNLLLHTMLVLDYDGEGFPVAFAISNRNDSVLLDVFLSSVKEKTGILKPKTLMTDLQESYWNSWQKVMGPTPFRLFCALYVHEAWKKNLRKICDTSKRKAVLQKLYDLLTENDENVFIEKLSTFINTEDEHLSSFLKYFSEEYLKNIHTWAYCYRKNAAVNTNLHLEAFHYDIKYLHGSGKHIKDLYTGLDVIKKYLLKNLKLFVIKRIKCKLTSKLKILRKAHDKFEKFVAEAKESIDVEECGEKKWFVKSFQKVNEDDPEQENQKKYLVERISETCPAKDDIEYGECTLECIECAVCAHLYRCSCPENSIRNNMCKHIHLICSFIKNTKSIMETTFSYCQSIESQLNHDKNYDDKSDLPICSFIKDDVGTTHSISETIISNCQSSDSYSNYNDIKYIPISSHSVIETAFSNCQSSDSHCNHDEIKYIPISSHSIIETISSYQSPDSHLNHDIKYKPISNNSAKLGDFKRKLNKRFNGVINYTTSVEECLKVQRLLDSLNSSV